MPRGKMDEDLYARLLEAYRRLGVNHAEVARSCGVRRDTARWAYFNGSARLGLEPIEEAIRADQEAVRADLAERERQRLLEEEARRREERNRAAEDARSARREEANLIRLGRSATTHVLANVVRMGPSLKSLAEAIQTKLEGGDVSVKDASLVLQRIGATARGAAAAGQTLMEMERLYLGEPTHILGVAGDGEEAMPLDEAFAHIMRANEALVRARERGVEELPGAGAAEDADGGGEAVH